MNRPNCERLMRETEYVELLPGGRRGKKQMRYECKSCGSQTWGKPEEESPQLPPSAQQGEEKPDGP